MLALEDQEMVDYSMPFRCMQYDVMEYGKQMEAMKKKAKDLRIFHTEVGMLFRYFGG